MTKSNKNLLPRVIKVLLDIIYGLLIFVLVGLAVWMVISPILVNRVGTLGTASVPVTLGTGDLARMEVTFQGSPSVGINDAFVEEANGILRLETNSPLLILIANGAKLIVAVGLAYIFYLLRKVMQTILDGEPFAANNVVLIRRLGYTVLLVGFGGSLLEGLATMEILNRLPATVPHLQAATTFDPRLILANTLFIFLLAQIWGYGMELERDKALTI
ncbi:MAG: hypothetical protein KAS84_06220 [Anaerolineales bacterium]|nr:hypothetical protein [Anaerolineales bacterium]